MRRYCNLYVPNFVCTREPCYWSFNAHTDPIFGGAPWIRKSIHPRKFGNHVTVHWLNDRPSAPQGNQCLITHFIASLGAQQQTNIALLHINVMINWQLSKQDIHWPVSPDRIAGSGVNPSRSSIFLLVFK